MLRENVLHLKDVGEVHVPSGFRDTLSDLTSGLSEEEKNNIPKGNYLDQTFAYNLNQHLLI